MEYFLVHGGDPDRDLPWPKAAVLGSLLGLAFWARNDAIFLAVAMATARVGMTLGRPPAVLRRRVGEMFAAAVTMACVSAPWLIHNAVRFGSVVPISGKAESATRFGNNLGPLPAKLAEFLTVVGAVPGNLEERASVQLACVLIVALAVFTALRALRHSSSPRLRSAAALALVHGGLLATYYGAFFGAGYFLSRYTSPISILAAFLTVGVGLRVATLRPLRIAFPLVLALVAIGLDIRHYRRSGDHMHFQVVSWVASHVPEDTWVGAIQSGTVGFFHDRTINLDGKTNPDALRARFENRMRPYILGSPIHILADWTGIASWRDWLTPFFEVIVDDPAANLAVLKRVS
jgi:hypothetical protein